MSALIVFTSNLTSQGIPLDEVNSFIKQSYIININSDIEICIKIARKLYNDFTVFVPESLHIRHQLLEVKSLEQWNQLLFIDCMSYILLLFKRKTYRTIP